MPDEESQEQPEFTVDEDWKKSVQEEKERAKEEAGPSPEVSFQGFIAGLYTQTLIALGEIPNPATEKKERQPEEAALLIDTIAMLQRKTDGNLDREETDYLQNLLTDLRMRYVRSPGAAEREEEPAEEESEAD